MVDLIMFCQVGTLGISLGIANGLDPTGLLAKVPTVSTFPTPFILKMSNFLIFQVSFSYFNGDILETMTELLRNDFDDE